MPILERVGFYKRMDLGFGYFLQREEIERRSATQVTDLFYGVPGLRGSNMVTRGCGIRTSTPSVRRSRGSSGENQ